MQLGILGSTRGTHLQTIIDAIQQKRLAARINLVISNKPDAKILERAEKHGLKNTYIASTGLTRELFDAQVSTLLAQHAIDLIVLVGYMRLLSNDFVNTWKNKIINVHPSLLPKHAGKMDLEVHRAVLLAEENESGCTVHYVTEEVDAGPIIIQKKCLVEAHDTPESLKQRVQTLEGEALIEAINMIGNADKREK